jgi:hypothetical protein
MFTLETRGGTRRYYVDQSPAAKLERRRVYDKEYRRKNARRLAAYAVAHANPEGRAEYRRANRVSIAASEARRDMERRERFAEFQSRNHARIVRIDAVSANGYIGECHRKATK